MIGRSVEEFLITARIERAKALLGNSSDSIEKIAEILGYGSPGFFSPNSASEPAPARANFDKRRLKTTRG